jgi:hypothetical protein
LCFGLIKKGFKYRIRVWTRDKGTEMYTVYTVYRRCFQCTQMFMSCMHDTCTYYRDVLDVLVQTLHHIIHHPSPISLNSTNSTTTHEGTTTRHTLFVTWSMLCQWLPVLSLAFWLLLILGPPNKWHQLLAISKRPDVFWLRPYR